MRKQVRYLGFPQINCSNGPMSELLELFEPFELFEVKIYQRQDLCDKFKILWLTFKRTLLKIKLQKCKSYELLKKLHLYTICFLSDFK